MILLVAFFAAVMWGLVRGGRISQLQSLTLRGYGLALAAFGIQLVVIYLPIALFEQILVRSVLFALSYLLLAVFCWWNRRLPGVWLIGLGMLANWTAMLANGGHMPVTYEALVAAGRGYLVNGAAPGTLVAGSKDILLPAAQTNLVFLADIFVVPPPFPIGAVFSIGDVLIALGLFWFIPYALGARPVSQLFVRSAAI